MRKMRPIIKDSLIILITLAIIFDVALGAVLTHNLTTSGRGTALILDLISSDPGVRLVFGLVLVLIPLTLLLALMLGLVVGLMKLVCH